MAAHKHSLIVDPMVEMEIERWIDQHDFARATPSSYYMEHEESLLNFALDEFEEVPDDATEAFSAFPLEPLLSDEFLYL